MMGMVVPPEKDCEGTSWTAVDRQEFINDMRYTKDAVERQIEADVPRIDLQIQENNSCCIPVHDGKVFHRLLRDVISDEETANAVLACCTQTVLAQPLCALHATLPDDVLITETGEHLSVRVRILDHGAASVRITKKLNLSRLRKSADIQHFRQVLLAVEYDTRHSHVFIGIA